MPSAAESSPEKMSLHSFVTYPILASVLVAAGSVGAYIMKAHSDGGHARHDAQVQQVDKHFDTVMKIHAEAEAEQNRLRNDAILRLERKQEWMMQNQGIGMPPNVPRLDDVPLSQRPGAVSDPTLDLLDNPDAGHVVLDNPGE